ncbi:squalene/phytoene synthase, putative [beta proteobacterium KB13]|uniref:Squalene/phytoene synthase, putative n=1 Tax=beta proteobacterium KB13 TaxID=314607 RepID=B6BU51_9PROT|nr:squalene/phytoene synthase, putative [beta proteobacterium KB13]
MKSNNYTSLKDNRVIKKHYENFSIAKFLPKENKNAIITIYAFARIGDDIADNENLSAKEKQDQLKKIKSQLDVIKNHRMPSEPLFVDLFHLIKTYKLNIQYFYQLLDAFFQDTTKKKYKNEKELFDYYEDAANAAGRLYLQVNQLDSKETYKYANHVCSAFAMIDMIQDIQEDLNKDRVYLPESLIKQYEIDVSALKKGQFHGDWQNFKNYWTDQINNRLVLGKGILNYGNWRFKLEMKLLISAGIMLSRKIKKRGNPFNIKMGPISWFIVFTKAIFLR